MNKRRALIVAALILTAAGLSISLFASKERAGKVTREADSAADLFRPVGRSEPTTMLSDTIDIVCPGEAHVAVIDLPADWFRLWFSVHIYPWKDIAILRNSATQRIEISCLYGDKDLEGNFAMTRAVPLSYSCERLHPDNKIDRQIICSLKPPEPPKPGPPKPGGPPDADTVLLKWGCTRTATGAYNCPTIAGYESCENYKRQGEVKACSTSANQKVQAAMEKELFTLGCRRRLPYLPDDFVCKTQAGMDACETYRKNGKAKKCLMTTK